MQFNLLFLNKKLLLRLKSHNNKGYILSLSLTLLFMSNNTKNNLMRLTHKVIYKYFIILLCFKIFLAKSLQLFKL